MFVKRDWTAQDVTELVLLSESHVNLRTISIRIGRSRAAIEGRLKKIKDQKAKLLELD